MEPDLPPQPEPLEPTRTLTPKLYLLILILVLLILASFFLFKSKLIPKFRQPGPSPQPTGVSLGKFSSFEEFKAYLQPAVLSPAGGDLAAVSEKSQAAGQVERVSATNVQVKGVDEADIVKTDGKDIYLSNLNPQILYRTLPEIGMPVAKTRVVAAFPLETLGKKAEIDQAGELFLANNILLVQSQNSLYAYDVIDSAKPKEIYKQEFDSRDQIIASRLYGQKVYLALRIMNSFDNCLIPLTLGDSPLSLNCTDIYRPDLSISADSVFTVLKLDLKSGQIETKNSFVGTTGTTVLYLSDKNLYLTYSFSEDYLDLFYNFYLSEGKDLITTEILARLKNLKEIDLSTQAKYVELSVILENYKQSLGEDELLKIENETKNRLTDYLKKNIRQIDKTGIVKLGLSDLSITANGVVPGKPLNQFSLDEYQGTLRLAQTVGSGLLTDYSANDVYLLDANLKEVGKITNLGLGERIYSARFIGDKGYLVTFKETDPFYVLDLSQPSQPKTAGELKIPGYSAYLHPLGKNLILGIGKEGQGVKLSLFDVADAGSPKEIAKYNLDDYWSEVLQTHKAFLQDAKYQFFFLPGSKGGYLFSYKDNNLKLLKAVSLAGVQRSVFINDYLYLISADKIVVLDEKTWETKKTLGLD